MINGEDSLLLEENEEDVQQEPEKYGNPKEHESLEIVTDILNEIIVLNRFSSEELLYDNRVEKESSSAMDLMSLESNKCHGDAKNHKRHTEALNHGSSSRKLRELTRKSSKKQSRISKKEILKRNTGNRTEEILSDNSEDVCNMILEEIMSEIFIKEDERSQEIVFEKNKNRSKF